MEIKEVVLPEERAAVSDFLSEFGLRYREDTEYTAYVLDGGDMVATVSYSGNTIMQLAVSKKMQGENVASTLITHIIAKMRERGIYSYKVFTKPENIAIFESLGFNLLVEDENFAALEGGASDIKSVISGMKTKITMELGGFSDDTAAIVVNGNPFTLGHLALCEYALSKHKHLILFVLEEEGSYFSFKERYSLAFIATRPYADRISVVPSSDYIVSRSTFPDYFLHTSDAATRAYARYDALIFEKYFMPELNIKKRYLGSEITDYMQIYNESVKEVLGDRAEVVERFKDCGKEISAKEVRALIEEGRLSQALSLVPNSCRAVLSLIINAKRNV